MSQPRASHALQPVRTLTCDLVYSNAISAIVQSHQEYDPSASFVADLFALLDRQLTRGRPAIIETTLNTVGRIARYVAEPTRMLYEC